MKKLFTLLITILFVSSCSLFSPNVETRQILLDAGAKLGTYAVDEYGGLDEDEYAYGKAVIVEGSDVLILISDGKTVVGVNLWIEANLISTVLKDMSIMIYTTEPIGASDNITMEIDKTAFTLGAVLPWSMKDTIKKLYDMETEDWKWIISQGLQTPPTSAI